MSKKRPPRYDAAFKRRAAEQVLLQKQPVVQVARRLHCSPQSVKNWIDQFRESIIGSPLMSARRTTFLPLQVDEELPTPLDSRIELVTKNGLTLRFPVDTPPGTMIDIVRSLEVVPC